MHVSDSLALRLSGFAFGAALGFATTLAVGFGGPTVGLAVAAAAVLAGGAIALRPRPWA